MTGASLNRGRSRQNYSTPRDFLGAVTQRFGRIDWDLAATDDAAVCARYLGPGSHVSDDALAVEWASVVGERHVAWLNPPFADIAPWAARCAALRERSGWTLLLVPASVGTVWWAEHVHGKGFAFWLSPRLTFAECSDPYPKDLALVAYGFGVHGAAPWKWRP
jgi:phage N-6-adenine-methyltransferase